MIHTYIQIRGESVFPEATAKKLWVQHSKQVKVRFIEPETLSIFAFFLTKNKIPAYKVTQYILINGKVSGYATVRCEAK